MFTSKNFIIMTNIIGFMALIMYCLGPIKEETPKAPEQYPYCIEADNRAPRNTTTWYAIATGDSVIEGVNH